ncbi:hypothetical protein ACROYT_G006824 [Oculina patagonica]
MLNSNENFKMDDSFTLNISHIQDPGRGGDNRRLKPGLAPIEEILEKKKCVLKIRNTDELCCARALVTLKARLDYGMDHWYYKNLLKGFPIQEKAAKELHQQAGVEEGPCGLKEIESFQRHLNQYQIVVVSVQHGYQIIFKGKEQTDDKRLILIKHHEHYHGCTSLGGFFGKSYYCTKCEKGFSHNDVKQHKCPGCHKTYDLYELKNKHRCGQAECPSCKKYHDLRKHQCYIQNPLKLEEERRNRKRTNDGRPKEPEPPIFVSWDAEARQDEGQHIANLICAMRSDTEQERTFEEENCVTNFLRWLRTLSERNHVIAVAHNFQGYDAYFILEELYREGVKPDQIVNGAKILSMSIPNITFKDSMCFLQMPLSSFPKSFRLTEQKKGFFPHFFNTVNNQNYVGRIPARDYYDPQGMSKERKEEFDRWYAERLAEDYEFDFQKELVSYCRSDVNLLHEGC